MGKNNIPIGSNVSGGKFKCNECDYIITMPSASSLPPCPKCKSNNTWKNLSGKGDAPSHPYPNKK